jgi:hypothetical protein
MTSAEHYDVVNGPSRWDLMLSLFLAEPHLVTFEALIPSPVRLTVSVFNIMGMVEGEWILFAYVLGVEHLSSDELKEMNPEQQEPIIHSLVRIHTRTEGNRHGSLWFIPPGQASLMIITGREEGA